MNKTLIQPKTGVAYQVGLHSSGTAVGTLALLMLQPTKTASATACRNSQQAGREQALQHANQHTQGSQYQILQQSDINLLQW
jgi:hypothetical protein